MLTSPPLQDILTPALFPPSGFPDNPGVPAVTPPPCLPATFSVLGYAGR